MSPSPQNETRAFGRGSTQAIQALDAGALEAVPKPNHANERACNALLTTLWLMAGVTVVRRRHAAEPLLAAEAPPRLTQAAGKIVGDVDPKTTSVEEIGLMMTGG